MSGFSRTEFTEFCEENKGYLYIIKCSNDNESFYKIGITKQEFLRKRFSCDTSMPYNVETIKTYVSHPSIIFDLETKLHQICKQHHYTPIINFGGYTECFTNIELAIEYVESLLWLSVLQEHKHTTNIKPKKCNFKKLCEDYILSIETGDNESRDFIEEFNPIFKDARRTFKANVIDDITASAMQQRRLQQRIDIQTHANTLMLDVANQLTFQTGNFYTNNEVKEQIQQTFNSLNIQKTAKATDLTKWFIVKKGTQMGSFGYRIIGRK